MKQPISGYHKDEENHWVAQLACGHFQHVRHDPPMTTREWTKTTAGRDSMIGFELNCVKCDEGAPPDKILDCSAPSQRMFVPERTNTILYCEHWDETVRFYRDLLMLKISFENEWFVEFQLTDKSFLSIANASRASIDAVGGQGVTLSWQTTDITRTRNELISLGIETTAPKAKWNAHLFTFNDPEGHRIEFWQPIEPNR